MGHDLTPGAAESSDSPPNHFPQLAQNAAFPALILVVAIGGLFALWQPWDVAQSPPSIKPRPAIAAIPAEEVEARLAERTGPVAEMQAEMRRQAFPLAVDGLPSFVRPPLVAGTQVKDFSLSDLFDGQAVELADLRRGAPVVLVLSSFT